MPSPVHLHADWDGPPPSGRPVIVLLHGFSGDATTWDALRPALREWGSTLAIDLLGHGRSPVPARPGPYALKPCLAQLAAVLKRLEIGRAWWLGYSMGGRVALQMAVHRPGLVAGLVLESASPGLAEPEERAARVRADGELAAFIEREGVAAFAARWGALPLFAGLKRLPPERLAALEAQRLRNDPAGLANALRGLGTGVMPSAWEALGRVRAPTLLLAGAEDAKFLALNRRMAAAIPGSTLRVVAGAGHNIHAERPDAFTAEVLDFLPND